jgi:hypothetical protein
MAIQESGKCIAKLNYIVVADQWRRQGFGRQLLNACRQRWPGIMFADPISPEGEALLMDAGAHSVGEAAVDRVGVTLDKAMLGFLEWHFRLRDLESQAQAMDMLKCRTVEDAIQRIFNSIGARVIGNRSQGSRFTCEEVLAILDRVAALHLRLFHGREAVSQEAVPDAQWIEEQFGQ